MIMKKEMNQMNPCCENENTFIWLPPTLMVYSLDKSLELVCRQLWRICDFHIYLLSTGMQ